MAKCFLILVPMLWLTACSDEPGRIRANVNQLIGVYQSSFATGQERLELKQGGIYIQDFRSGARSFRHVGRWDVENHIFGGTDVVLLNAVVDEDDKTNSQRTGDRILNVHLHSGKLALARNEVMDFYYEQVH